ncbi:hypothetical protein CROQUDRAFT_88065 [Cronartium quercuum f. sp. fusiforme G11]|uniref:Uncharacterized protein n=1 Tax=Cronartium quercuum f. sp. fusiforme G11 TaxID=708437 RepID=A0A9P6NVL9_9BASI|nr:hypothetical protein CROQUDRAFT_88065 [Cronartium quercuum f. sp. fusiforme G11]
MRHSVMIFSIPARLIHYERPVARFYSPSMPTSSKNLITESSSCHRAAFCVFAFASLSQLLYLFRSIVSTSIRLEDSEFGSSPQDPLKPWKGNSLLSSPTASRHRKYTRFLHTAG